VRIATVAASRDFDVVEIRGALAPYEEPFAPAGLYDLGTERIEVAQLHKIVARDAERQTASFRTFAPHRVSGALVGQEFVYRPWWTPDQLDVVVDISRKWVLEQYPDDGTHAHCQLTWEAISGYASPSIGYRCGSMWLIVDAYEKIVRDDCYQCRASA
jgi:hypothetical protein